MSERFSKLNELESVYNIFILKSSLPSSLKKRKYLSIIVKKLRGLYQSCIKTRSNIRVLLSRSCKEYPAQILATQSNMSFLMRLLLLLLCSSAVWQTWIYYSLLLQMSWKKLPSNWILKDVDWVWLLHRCNGLLRFLLKFRSVRMLNMMICTGCCSLHRPWTSSTYIVYTEYLIISFK